MWEWTWQTHLRQMKMPGKPVLSPTLMGGLRAVFLQSVSILTACQYNSTCLTEASDTLKGETQTGVLSGFPKLPLS